MSELFDVTNGDVHIGNQIVLRSGITPQELASAGLIFGREFDMKTGWVHRIVGPQTLAGHVIQLSLRFQNNSLKNVSLGVAGNPKADLDQQFKEHNAFLYQELGSPTTQDKWRQSICYQYEWGNIFSGVDLRGGRSYILVTWA